MASYKAFKKRQENASPYANNANCRKCKYGEWVRTSAFCSGFGKVKKIRYDDWDTEKKGYCTQFVPKGCGTCKHFPPNTDWPCVDCDMSVHDRWE